MRYRKDPQDKEDFGFDWEPWLSGDSIASSTWTVEPSGLTMSNQTSSATKTTVFLSGGTLGVQYKVTNHIVTSASPAREMSWSLQVLIEEK